MGLRSASSAMILPVVQLKPSVRKTDISSSILTFLDPLDFQWLLRAPGRDSESKEGDAPRLQPQFRNRYSEPMWSVTEFTLV